MRVKVTRNDPDLTLGEGGHAAQMASASLHPEGSFGPWTRWRCFLTSMSTRIMSGLAPELADHPIQPES